MTTYTEENPGYAILDVDRATMLPVNWRIFAMDVAKANETGKPEWGQLTDYTQDYGLVGGISPETIMDFTERYQTDADLYWQFAWDKSRHYGEKPSGHHENSAKADLCRFTANSDYADKICNHDGDLNTKMDTMDRVIG